MAETNTKGTAENPISIPRYLYHIAPSIVTHTSHATTFNSYMYVPSILIGKICVCIQVTILLHHPHAVERCIITLKFLQFSLEKSNFIAQILVIVRLCSRVVLYVRGRRSKRRRSQVVYKRSLISTPSIVQYMKQ